ncbi:MAG: hypothetical protein WAL95_20470 [Candidatus Acidiferrales bacterium]
MDEQTRENVASSLDNLASQDSWNISVWQRCYDLIAANMAGEDLLGYVHDDVIHYNGVYHSRNIFGFRVEPDRSQLEEYRREFRDVATSIRLRLSLTDARKKFGF